MIALASIGQEEWMTATCLWVTALVMFTLFHEMAMGRAFEEEDEEPRLVARQVRVLGGSPLSVHRLAWSRTPGLGPDNVGSNPAVRTTSFRLSVPKLRPVPEYIVGWPNGDTLTGHKSSLGMVRGENPRPVLYCLPHETPGDSFGQEMYWLLPFLPDGAGMVPAGQFFAWPIEI